MASVICAGCKTEVAERDPERVTHAKHLPVPHQKKQKWCRGMHVPGDPVPG